MTVDVPDTIDPTGATDVTAQLQAFFDGVPAGATIRFPASALYRVGNTPPREKRAP